MATGPVDILEKGNLTTVLVKYFVMKTVQMFEVGKVKRFQCLACFMQGCIQNLIILKILDKVIIRLQIT